MPRPDPLPSPGATTLRRFRRGIKWLGLLSMVIAAIAVLLVAHGDEGVHIHMLIATALGVALTVFLGTALMMLTFLSASSGHDDQAGRHGKEKDAE